MTDPYVHPGSDVLINNFDIRDAALLEALERRITARRFTDLPEWAPTYEAYKAIHKYVFQDVYPWAGEVRKIDIAKVVDETSKVEFLKGPFVDVQMRRLFKELEADKFLRNLDKNTFAFRAAVYVAELNFIHPFREGNGRTQRAFLKQLAEQAGHRLDLRGIQPEAWIKASRESLAPAADRSVREEDYREMTAVIKNAMSGWRQSQRRGRGF